MDRLALGRPAFSTEAGALSTEWLLTNGLGGFASGTVGQANTRRYHGLLVASLKPPLERVLMVAKADTLVRYRGATHALACNEFSDGTIAPHGYQRLAAFHLEGTIPVWTYAIGDALLEIRIWMAHGHNTTHVQYRLLQAATALGLEITPLCTYRDYHAHSRGSRAFGVQAGNSACTITAFEGARPYTLSLDRGQFRAESDWHWNFHHRVEAERGLDSDEDLFRPGTFHAELSPGETLTLTMSAEPQPAPPSLREEMARQSALLSALPATTPAWVRQLTLAADQFLVARGGGNATATGTTVIAGYPWFGDWGRDTMIALPGLALATGRHAEAASILRTYASHLSQGMLPNRFPDGNEPPEYNTVDATLWYFHALAEYYAATKDLALVRELYPGLCDIIDWHQRGTRFGIQVDPADGLLRAGESGVQLTWMDAKVGDWVVTPRTGKAVEINALWHYALVQMQAWARKFADHAASRRFGAAARTAADSFRAAFWCETRSCLYDVIDGPDGELVNGRRVDSSMRPNQLFAVSLGTDLLQPDQRRAVVDACSTLLLTPLGLRSLEAAHPAYVANYRGGPQERDASYHQGTVWSWLLGPFAIAHQRVYGNTAHSLALLDGVAAHLAEACIGTISEIFDGAAPHAARGCYAQAWSVAETLRAWHRLNGAQTQQLNDRKVPHVRRHG
ncbi:MAG TPA: amylo-alpha-1,6-glucosidase [Steroidobacteraceae bacterium]|nr:amylo-alpha-1,6-glucosidase [Steroidobacteraceae bacterium]